MPFFRREIWHKVQLFPSTDIENNLIQNFEPRKIIIYKNNNTYIDDVETMKISKKTSITTGIITIFKQITSESDCKIQSIVNDEHTCQLVKISKKYDKWTEIIPGTFAFVSNIQKYVACGENRFNIKQNSGVIRIREDCQIETPTAILTQEINKTTNQTVYIKTTKMRKETIETPTGKTGLGQLKFQPSNTGEEIDDLAKETEEDGIIIKFINEYKYVTTMIGLLILFFSYKCTITLIKTKCCKLNNNNQNTPNISINLNETPNATENIGERSPIENSTPNANNRASCITIENEYL